MEKLTIYKEAELSASTEAKGVNKSIFPKDLPNCCYSDFYYGKTKCKQCGYVFTSNTAHGWTAKNNNYEEKTEPLTYCDEQEIEKGLFSIGEKVIVDYTEEFPDWIKPPNGSIVTIIEYNPNETDKYIYKVAYNNGSIPLKEEWLKPITSKDNYYAVYNENGEIEEKEIQMEEKTQGKKTKEGKLRWDLVPYDALEEVVKVMTSGVKEYGERNWELGISYADLAAAMQRHFVKWFQRRIDLDEKTNLPNLAHLIANAMYLLAYQIREMNEFDDRPGERR